MENKTIILMRKQNIPFSVTYPYTLPDGRSNANYKWKGTTNGTAIDEKPVPLEVFEWLRDNTSTIRDGELIIKEVKTDDFDINQSICDTSDIEKSMADKIKTESELAEMISKGNQNAFKSALDSIIEGVEDEQAVKSIKAYVYRSYANIGIDSNAKRKVLCDWYGSNYEDVGYIFDKTSEK